MHVFMYHAFIIIHVMLIAATTYMYYGCQEYTGNAEARTHNREITPSRQVSCQMFQDNATDKVHYGNKGVGNGILNARYIGSNLVRHPAFFKNSQQTDNDCRSNNWHILMFSSNICRFIVPVHGAWLHYSTNALIMQILRIINIWLALFWWS